MEILKLTTVLDAERQACAVGAASQQALSDTAKKWLLERDLKLLAFEDGVAEVIERLMRKPH